VLSMLDWTPAAPPQRRRKDLPPEKMTIMATGEDIRKLWELSVGSMNDCRRAYAMAEDPAQPFDGDVLWALCTVYADGLAVNVKPPEARAQWNINVGAKRAADLRERDGAIAEAYPPKSAAPAP
jgi:hypothetical protein